MFSILSPSRPTLFLLQSLLITPFHETRLPNNQPGGGEKWIGCHYFSASLTALIIQLVIHKPSSLFQSVPWPSCFTIWPCYLLLLGASSPVGLALSTIFSFQSFRQYLSLFSTINKITDNICVTAAFRLDIIHFLLLIQQPGNTTCRGRAVRFPLCVKSARKLLIWIH